MISESLQQASQTSTSSPPSKARCLLCGEAISPGEAALFDTRFGVAEPYTIGRCDYCGLEQLAHPPDPESLERLYALHYNFGGDASSPYARVREWFFSSWLYRLWMIADGDISFHSRKGRGRLLDVGCNQGRGLSLYRRNGFEVEGLELNPVAADQARQRGFQVTSCPLEQVDPALGRYDVIVMSNVLEHVPDPKQSLRAVFSLLTDSGELWISCPNRKSWLRHVFGRYWINWHIPFHLTFFDGKTLADLLDSLDFEILAVTTRTPAVWFAFSVIAAFFSKPTKPTLQLRNPALVVAIMLIARLALFPVLWAFDVLGKGDCLLVRASKRPVPVAP